MSEMDRLLGALNVDLAAQTQQQSESEAQHGWALEHAREIVRRYVATLKQGGIAPASIERAVYTRQVRHVRTGGWWSGSKREEHSWVQTRERETTGWPVLPVRRFAEVRPSAIVDRDRDVPATNAVCGVAYAPATDTLYSVVVDGHDLVGGSPWDDHFDVLASSGVLLTADPKVEREVCDARDGCGLPVWVARSVGSLPRDPLRELRVSSPVKQSSWETPLHEAWTISAPAGRGDDVYRFYLEELVTTLSRQLERLDLEWTER